MSKDIVERLRDVENYDAEITRYEAADEIERLRALITEWANADEDDYDTWRALMIEGGVTPRDFSKPLRFTSGPAEIRVEFNGD